MIPIARPSLPPLEDYVALLQQIWDSRMLSNFAAFSEQLEQEARDYLYLPHALAVVSCDIGLIVVLKALDLPTGAPCFISDFTFNSTINAAIWAGLTPVLVDIDPATFNMSPDALRIEMARVGQPGAVLATHVFGNPCDVEGIQEAASEHGSFLVFDAAHAYGSLHNGAHIGGNGDAEVFSFSGTKLVTSGEGGLIATRHDWMAEKIRYLRAYGFQDDYRSRYVGINGKMSELHAALGLLSLREIEHVLERRAAHLATYRTELADLVGWQLVQPVDRSTYKDLAIWVGRARAEVEQALDRAGVQSKRYFVPLHTMDPYRSFANSELRAADEVHQATLCVPLFPDLTTDEIVLIAGAIRQALSKASA